MRIEVADPQNLSTQEDIDRLIRVVFTIEDGWHEWAGPDPKDDGMAAYFERRPSDMELLEKSYARSVAYPDEVPRKVVELVVSPPGPLASSTSRLRISLKDGSTYLKQPLKILVENAINDAKFLKRYLHVVDPSLVELFDSRDAPVEFDHSGGKPEMINHLNSRAAVASSNGIPLRLIVIFDGDSSYPGHVTSETNTVRAACVSAGALWHVFTKRSIENYITERDLHAYATEFGDVAPAVRFILSLTGDQRDFYPFKKGFPGSSKMDGQIKLYAGIHATTGSHKLKRAADYMINTSQISVGVSDLEANRSLSEFVEIARLIRMEL